MNPLLGIAFIGAAVAASKRGGAGSLASVSDELIDAYFDLVGYIGDMTEDGTLVHMTNNVSPLLPDQLAIALRGSHDEKCSKARNLFHDVFRKTERVERAAGAEYSGDTLKPRSIAARLRTTKARVRTEDIEEAVEFAHEVQNAILYGAGSRGCFPTRA